MNRRSCTLAAVAIGMAMLAGRTLADPSVCHKLFPTESCSGHDPFPNIPNGTPFRYFVVVLFACLNRQRCCLSI